MLEIENIWQAEMSPSLVQIAYENYVPIRFRSYLKPGDVEEGVRHFLLGTQRRRLDLIVTRQSFVLRGLTIDVFDRVSGEGLVGPSQTVGFGLPVLRLPQGVEFIDEESMAVDTGIDFSVFVGESFVEVKIGGASSFDRAYRHGDVRFLIDSQALVGIRIEGLSQEQVELFKSYLHPKNGG